MEDKKRNKYAEKLAEKASISYQEAYEEMSALRKATGVSFADYVDKDLHSMDPHVRFREAEIIVKRKEKRKQFSEEAAAYLGTDPAGARAEIKRLNGKFDDVYHITMAVFHDYELYKDDDETIEKKLKLFAERKSLCDRFKEIYDDADYDLHLPELEELFGRIADINRELMSATLMDRYAEDFAFRYPQMGKDEGSKKEITVDSLSLRLSAGFSRVEYIMFDLFSRPFSEKLTYSSEREMTELVRSVNDPEIRQLLDDKYSCYKSLRRFYGRDMVLITKPEDAGHARLFFFKNKTFVKKPCYSRQGRGIKAVDSADYAGTKEMVDALLKEDGAFVAEGIVNGHQKTAAFNPDSLNTVRIVTVNTGMEITGLDDSREAVRNGVIRYAGKGIYCCGALFKTGRRGSFVDNGGAGGYFSALDLNTGRSTATASGENGTECEYHPDSGEYFGSLCFDSIDKAIEMVREAAMTIPGAKIIGWDLALTEKGKWLLVEGNYSPTFLGQAPAGLGIHKEVRMMADAIQKR